MSEAIHVVGTFLLASVVSIIVCAVLLWREAR